MTERARRGMVACAAARASGALIKRSLGRVRKISYKGRINIVTDVDKRSERTIVAMLRKHFTNDAILSEEGTAFETHSRYRWVIDPLDGTTNFSRSFPFFCVSIALEEEGKVVIGVVYDPMRDELFYACRGAGAYCNKRRIRVSSTARLKHGLLATGFSYSIQRSTNDNINNFVYFLKRAMAIRRAGAAALDLAYVACGRFDGFWELDLRPWDSAAGALLVTEAGGTVTRFNGSCYSHYDRDILASNTLLHRQMVRGLSKRQ